MDRDLDITGRLAARLERSTSWGRAVGAAGLAAGFADALREELDLRVEMRNMTAVAAADCATPAGERAALARTLLDCLFREIMLTGIFHADPHLGNVLLLPGGRRMLGRFLAQHVGPGITPGVTMFTDLFRIVCEHGLVVPPEVAAVFRALATMEGTLTQLAPGFDIAAEARRFAAEHLAAQFSPDVLRKTAADELVALLADPADRRYLSGLLHQAILVVLAATSGIMAVLMLGLRDGPSVTATVSLYAFLGYCLLTTAAILALRVLLIVFHPDTR